MEFRILGPLEVLDEGRAVPLGGSRQRALLALLLLHVNETLTTDRLVDELWGERPPAGAAKTVQVQISRLRKALGAAGEVVVTRDAGYELALDRDRLDAHRFERLLTEGGRELAAGRPQPAAAALEQALALWRGAPLADLAYEPFAQAAIARLEELRLSAIEQQIDAELELGRHADVVGRLPAVIAEHPYREHLRGQLMLALYRCERQADALQAYQDARRELVEELGIEPGERLRELERAILAQDATLALPVAAADGTPAPRPEARPPPLPQSRRLVSVVCAGLAGSPALAERLDPETLHALLDRYSALCARVIERHGGTAEPYAGDAVVGIFGLPALHEDDPLRAVRAALDLREAAVAEGLAVRLGIDSGEVFVGAGALRAPYATGDAIHVAAGLQEHAGEGEILLAERAQQRLDRDVRAEARDPLSVPGRRAPVRAWRLLALRSAEQTGPPAGPLVGRGRELRDLREAFAAARDERACRLLTVIGPPGIGKSRLARELVTELAGEATVAVGRCLSYGDGITYRPLAEIVRRLGGEPALTGLLAGEEQAEAIARRVLGAIGLADEPAQAVETFWAVRRLMEAAARERPLVAIVDDAHWAEPTLLDLLDYIVSFSSGAPILLLCLARPELLEHRPAWAAPQPSRSLLVLDALARADAHALVETLAGDDLEPRAAGRIVATAEGNPLFLEQLVAVRAEGEGALPPSIEAVLAARIDALDPDERDLLLHASVEGRTFHRGAVAGLVGEEAIAGPLIGLVRKGLIRPDRPEFAGEDAFRFSHALIREAAYAGLPKRLRAELHERVAGWLGAKPRVPDEIVGYHLEQACRHRRELGESELPLAAEAVDRLAAGARAAHVRGDDAAAARLLERAVELDPASPELLATLGAALAEAGRLADADGVLARAIEHAEAEEDRRVAARARVERELVRLHAGTDSGVSDARRVAEEALTRLAGEHDELGQCRAWRLLDWIEWTESRVGRADEASRRAAAHARRAGDDRELFEILGWRASAAVFGPTPVPEAIERCARIRDQVRTSPLAVAITLHPLGLLHAMTGDFERARRLAAEADEILGELGWMSSAMLHPGALVELLAGRPEAAEARLRPGYERLEEMGERALLATTAALLAQAVAAQGRDPEARELCGVSEEIAAAEDVATQVIWRGVRAGLEARRGDLRGAEALAREAVRLAEPTDLLTVRADALLGLAGVLRQAGRTSEAEAAARGGIELHERKGNVVAAARARSQREEAAPA